MPLWLDDPDRYGMNARDTSRARAAGLVTRPLDQTLTDPLAWELARPEPGPHGAGITDKEERSLLDSLAAPSASRSANCRHHGGVDTSRHSEDRHAQPVTAGGPHARHPDHGQPSSG